MKIGIITIHNSPNYGACLQSFALWKFLIDNGYDCEIIDLHRPCNEDYVFSNQYLPCRFNEPNFIRRIKTLVKKIIGRKEFFLQEETKRKFEEFNSQVRLGHPYCGIDELYANPPQYDIYISGSDQVWNPAHPFCIEPYLLTFVPAGKKKISYASSIGITDLTEKEINLFKNALEKYDAISVRELQAKKLLEKILNKDIYQVADPTFLLSTEKWKSIAVFPKNKEKYILLFALRNDIKMLEYALTLGKQSGLKIVYLTTAQPKSTGEYEAVDTAGPREWIGYIANAEIVITDSFHGTVFSIITGCNNFFTRIANESLRGSRITDLLDKFDLNNHLLKSDMSQTYRDLTKIPINHGYVSMVMKSECERAKQYLAQNIR